MSLVSSDRAGVESLDRIATASCYCLKSAEADLNAMLWLKLIQVPDHGIELSNSINAR